MGFHLLPTSGLLLPSVIQNDTFVNMTKKHYKVSLPKPEAGILECGWTIEATDEDDFIAKFSSYLIELKRQYSRPPLPIGKSNHPGEVGKELFHRLTQITEPIAFIVTLHCFVEHWLDQILLKFCPNRDLTEYRFYQKLEIVYVINKIPANLFQNLLKLNKLRNAVAHQPDCDLTKMDLGYLDCHPLFQTSQYKPSYAPDAKEHHIFNALNAVMAVTYFALHKHCMEELGFNAESIPEDAQQPPAAHKA
jgi:hypothetical protein